MFDARLRITNLLLALVLVALIGVIAMLATDVRGGPLDPPGGPNSTMRTLDELSGAWSRDLSATGGCDSERFDCVLNDEAVLDRNTGLVWDRFPFPANAFFTAVAGCLNNNRGGVFGWRLASAEELLSLVKPGITNPALPVGHPFTGVQNANYWSSTFDTGTTNNQLWGVNMATGGVTTQLDAASGNAPIWCVRGGRGYDGLR